jgi:hypothetical protein
MRIIVRMFPMQQHESMDVWQQQNHAANAMLTKHPGCTRQCWNQRTSDSLLKLGWRMLEHAQGVLEQGVPFKWLCVLPEVAANMFVHVPRIVCNPNKSVEACTLYVSPCNCCCCAGLVMKLRISWSIRDFA